MGRGNPSVRVWEEVKEAFKAVAGRYSIRLSDLVSIVLAYSAALSPAAVILGLEEELEIEKEDAAEIANALRERVLRYVLEGLDKGDSAVIVV